MFDFYSSASAYITRRNSAVIQAVCYGNLYAMKALFQSSNLQVPEDDVLMRIAHELCVHTSEMPKNLNKKSRKWLAERKYND